MCKMSGCAADLKFDLKPKPNQENKMQWRFKNKKSSIRRVITLWREIKVKKKKKKNIKTNESLQGNKLTVKRVWTNSHQQKEQYINWVASL